MEYVDPMATALFSSRSKSGPTCGSSAAAPAQAAVMASTNKTITVWLVIALVPTRRPFRPSEEEAAASARPGVGLRLKVEFGDVPKPQAKHQSPPQVMAG